MSDVEYMSMLNRVERFLERMYLERREMLRILGVESPALPRHMLN